MTDDEAKELAWEALQGTAVPNYFRDNPNRTAFSFAWDAAADHFAKERDELQAVIAGALDKAKHNTLATPPDVVAILSQSPSGALAVRDRENRRIGWEEGHVAGTVDQMKWDGWRYPDGYPTINPYEGGTK